MRRLLVTCLVAALLTGAPSADARHASEPASSARARTVTLDGVDVRLRSGTEQVITVNRRRGHHAQVTLWALRGERWRAVQEVSDGRIGYGGLVRGTRRRQGTGTTPLGTYRLTFSFGTHRRARDWTLPHRKIRKGDFWVQDNASDHYNRYRNQRQGGFRWWLPTSNANSSERLTDYGRQYEYVVVMDFNRNQVRHRGAGIFLHVNGSGATAGCVSAPRSFLQLVLRRLDPAKRPVIAVGR